jgi:hypothetical protein
VRTLAIVRRPESCKDRVRAHTLSSRRGMREVRRVTSCRMEKRSKDAPGLGGLLLSANNFRSGRQRHAESSWLPNNLHEATRDMLTRLAASGAPTFRWTILRGSEEREPGPPGAEPARTTGSWASGITTSQCTRTGTSCSAPGLTKDLRERALASALRLSVWVFLKCVRLLFLGGVSPTNFFVLRARTTLWKLCAASGGRECVICCRRREPATAPTTRAHRSHTRARHRVGRPRESRLTADDAKGGPKAVSVVVTHIVSLSNPPSRHL